MPTNTSTLRPVAAIAHNSMVGLTCFEANPDIAGIGTRLAIYLQAIIGIVFTFIAAFDGKITPVERRNIRILPHGNLILSSALAINGMIQTFSKTLSAYHAGILLCMGLILEGPLIGTSVSNIAHDLARVRRAELDSPIGQEEDFIDPMCHSMGLTLWLALSRLFNVVLRFAITARIVSPEVECSVTGVFPILLLGRADKVIWMVISAIHGLDIVCGFWIVYRKPVKRVGLVAFFTRKPSSDEMGRIDISRSKTYIRLWAAATVIGVIIAQIELLIIHGAIANLVGGNENSWGFGQILALLALASQAIGVSRVVKEWLDNIYKLLETKQKANESSHVGRRSDNEPIGIVSGIQLAETTLEGQIRARNPKKSTSDFNLHQLLRYYQHDVAPGHCSPLLWDLRESPESAPRVVHLDETISAAQLSQHATSPPILVLHITCDLFPDWPIEVRRLEGITIQDVLDAIYTMLQRQILHQEWDTFSKKHQARIASVFGNRCKSAVNHDKCQSRGVLRVDCLLLHTLFAGLSISPDLEDACILTLRRPQNLVPERT